MKSFLFFLCVFPLILSAQTVDEWGKVNSYYRQMDVYEKDTSAEAIILFDLGDISVSYDDWKYVFSHHKRIKLLKESSLARGSIKLPYYTGNDLEFLRNLRSRYKTAYTGKI
ncbi:MAG: hypothetical protein AAFO82_09090 [Bacteroidota bacterium]